jgi:hypothetical protein
MRVSPSYKDRVGGLSVIVDGRVKGIWLVVKDNGHQVRVKRGRINVMIKECECLNEKISESQL